MRRVTRILCAAVFAVTLFAGAEAAAQFANRSISLTAGYMNLNEAGGFEWGLPIGLEASLYVDSGWETTLAVDVMILTERINGTQVVGLHGGPGMRYLFLEEDLRPYLGADLTFLYVFGDVPYRTFVGLAPKGGIDYFIGETVSVGVEAKYAFYVMLNQPLQTSARIGLKLGAWF